LITEQITGKKYQIFSLFIILFSFLISCRGPFDSHDSIPDGHGRVTINLAGGNARTSFPSKVFDNYVYTFTKSNGSPEVKDPVNGSFTLETGSWTVEVKAYAGVVASDNLAATGTSDAFTITANAPTNVTVVLTGNEAGHGKLSYKITFPAGATVAEMTMKKLPDMLSADGVTLNQIITGGTTINHTADNVPAGFYLLTVRMLNGGNSAGVTLVRFWHGTFAIMLAKLYKRGIDQGTREYGGSAWAEHKG